MKKIIIVEKCSPNDCPYCTPDPYNQKYNYCDCGEGWGSINRVKTFPRSCPLEDCRDDLE